METRFQILSHKMRNHLQALGLGLDLLNPYNERYHYTLTETDEEKLWKDVAEHFKQLSRDIITVLEEKENGDEQSRAVVGSRDTGRS